MHKKHPDFLRDSRSDTVHSSTLKLMHDLGGLNEFLALPQHRAFYNYAQFGETRFRIAEVICLPTCCCFIAFMPERDYFNNLAQQS